MDIRKLIKIYQRDLKRIEHFNRRIQDYQTKLSTSEYGYRKYTKMIDQEVLEECEDSVQVVSKRLATNKRLLLNDIDKLTNDTQRQILTMRFIDGVSVKDISIKIGCSKDYIYRVSTKGLNNLSA